MWISNQAAFFRVPSEEWRKIDLAVRTTGKDPLIELDGAM
jgi:hypothetical protein